VYMKVRMARSLLLFVSLAVAASCKTTRVAPAPSEPDDESAQTSAPEERQESAVDLPAPPALPPLPLGLQSVPVPESNPTSPEKVELGWMLFFDTRLSKDGSMACVECHRIDKAYTSGNALDGKVGGASNTRNSPSVLNVGSLTSFYWDGRMPTLEAVCNAAWKRQLGADPPAVAEKLNQVQIYRAMFIRAFGEQATAANIPLALAGFLRELSSGNSPWDRFNAGEASALTREAQDGLKLFQSKGCTGCHVPPLFTDGDFHNAGIGADPGRRDATKADADTGKFKTPSLRNVALTAPYFHDGHAATLDEAIELMVGGGIPNPRLDPNLKARKTSARELKALKAFLTALTGESTFTRAPALP
jgi:cytochrome c peroxidase